MLSLDEDLQHPVLASGLKTKQRTGGEARRVFHHTGEEFFLISVINLGNILEQTVCFCVVVLNICHPASLPQREGDKSESGMFLRC